MPAGFFVQIIESATNNVEKELGPYASERLADRADNGVNINLDQERFYTLVVERREAVQYSRSA